MADYAKKYGSYGSGMGILVNADQKPNQTKNNSGILVNADQYQRQKPRQFDISSPTKQVQSNYTPKLFSQFNDISFTPIDWGNSPNGKAVNSVLQHLNNINNAKLKMDQERLLQNNFLESQKFRVNQNKLISDLVTKKKREENDRFKVPAPQVSGTLKSFKDKLSPELYDKWVPRLNKYSNDVDVYSSELSALDNMIKKGFKKRAITDQSKKLDVILRDKASMIDVPKEQRDIWDNEDKEYLAKIISVLGGRS